MVLKRFSRYTTAKPSDAAFSTVLQRSEVVSDVISGTADQDVGMDVCANFRDSRLKPSEASFSASFRTSITSDRKYIMTSYPVQL